MAKSNARLDDGYASADEEMAPPGLSAADLTRRTEIYQAAEYEDIETLRRIAAAESAEKEHNRRVFGQTYRERTAPRHKRCINYCRAPGQREARRCPTCYGHAETRHMSEIPGDIEPTPGRRERFWIWAGWVIGTIWLGITYPWRLDHIRMRRLLEEALTGMVVEVERPGAEQ